MNEIAFAAVLLAWLVGLVTGLSLASGRRLLPRPRRSAAWRLHDRYGRL
ncbi:MAG TPA: hypothetical protein VFV01_47915 [Spirillospora sp.]|nr:hypothetical protein [Spirillospora sp.]